MTDTPRKRTKSRTQDDKRRVSSFSSTSSPWFRRNSFLSNAMIHSENISVYESSNYYADCSSYNIISLKECQGFIFNQDLFASPYQQQRTLANERRLRAMSFSNHKPSSKDGSRSNSASNLARRHTSFNISKPSLDRSMLDSSSMLDSNAIMDDDDEEDGTEMVSSGKRGSQQMDSIRQAFDQFDNTTIDIELSSQDEDAVGEEYDEYEGIQDDESTGMYKVHVTEIVVNEGEDIFPS